MKENNLRTESVYNKQQKIDELKQQLEATTKLKNLYITSFQGAQKEVGELEKQLDEANKVIDFYGNLGCPVVSDNEEIQEMSNMDNTPYYRGGKMARNYLTKYNKG